MAKKHSKIEVLLKKRKLNVFFSYKSMDSYKKNIIIVLIMNL